MEVYAAKVDYNNIVFSNASVDKIGNGTLYNYLTASRQL